MSDVSIEDDNDNTSNKDGCDNDGSSSEGSNGKETEDAAFHRAAWEIMNRAGQRVGTAATENCCFCSFFGVRFKIVHMVWDMLGEGGLCLEKSESKHLLWTLYFLEVYPWEGLGSAAVGGLRGAVNPKTMRKWVWLLLERIAELADEVVSPFIVSFSCLALPLTSFFVATSLAKPQIVFESRFEHDVQNKCLTTINGTDYCIQQKGVAKKENLFGPHKYGGKSALCYKLGINILTRNLVWVLGPYPEGRWTDVMIFNGVLAHLLKPVEHTKVNNGYAGRADKVNYCNPPKSLGMQSTARLRHETFNECLKNWGILDRVYPHGITVGR